MMQNIVLVIVIIVSLWAHVWLYLWMKFKMDEGQVTRCLKDAESTLTSLEIADRIDMKHGLIEKICSRSKEIKRNDQGYFV